MKRLYIIKNNNTLQELEALEAKKNTTNTYPLSFIYEDCEGHGGDRYCSFDINDDYSVIIIIDLFINQFISNMRNFGYKFDIYDGNNDLLNDKINLGSVPDYLKEEIKEYYYNIFNSDDILDKLNKIGFDNLNESDKLILKNSGQ